MPELPEVETVVRELRKKLKNRQVSLVEVFTPKIIGLGLKTLSPKRKVLPDIAPKFSSAFLGFKVLDVKRRAKLIIFEFVKQSKIDLEKKYLLVHLKMTGQFIFEDQSLRKKTGGRYRILNKESAPLVGLPYKHTHTIFYFTDGSKLYFNDVRRFGYLKLLSFEELSLLEEIAGYGPEPLSSKFTFDYFLEKIQKKKFSIKQALMENSLVVGIGNIYSDEILFHAKILPNRYIDGLSESEIKKVYENIFPVLKKGIQAKGSSVGDFIRTDGSLGKMGKHHFVYGRKGKSCLVCGSRIESAKLGGRTTCFCLVCQK